MLHPTDHRAYILYIYSGAPSKKLSNTRFSLKLVNKAATLPAMSTFGKIRQKHCPSSTQEQAKVTSKTPRQLLL